MSEVMVSVSPSLGVVRLWGSANVQEGGAAPASARSCCVSPGTIDPWVPSPGPGASYARVPKLFMTSAQRAQTGPPGPAVAPQVVLQSSTTPIKPVIDSFKSNWEIIGSNT